MKLKCLVSYLYFYCCFEIHSHDPLLKVHTNLNYKHIRYQNIPREFELAILRALATKRVEHPSVDVKQLHPMVVGVADYHLVCVGHGDVVRVFQLASLAAVRSELPHERSI